MTHSHAEFNYFVYFHRWGARNCWPQLPRNGSTVCFDLYYQI